jgi:hypothetical protein
MLRNPALQYRHRTQAITLPLGVLPSRSRYHLSADPGRADCLSARVTRVLPTLCRTFRPMQKKNWAAEENNSFPQIFPFCLFEGTWA